MFFREIEITEFGEHSLRNIGCLDAFVRSRFYLHQPKYYPNRIGGAECSIKLFIEGLRTRPIR